MSEEQFKDKDEMGLQENEAPEIGREDSNWPKWAALFFFCVMVAGIAYALHERNQAQQVSANYDQMGTMLKDAQAQIAGLSARLNALSTQAAQTSTPATPASATGEAGNTTHSTHAKTTAARRHRADDPRWKKVQSQLDDQQKQIAETQKNLDQARSDLTGQITSSHDELNGTIAKNHDELVNLEKKGERNFYEFNLTKSKQFQRVGPISIALRKANTKHLFCDLNLMVDDNMLSKKHVSLFEPVQFFPSDYGQPLQIVIYQIDKNEARGYVSAPKYRQSELQQSSNTLLNPQQSSSTPAAQPQQPQPAQTQTPAKTAQLDRRVQPQQ
jgi:hypothetical protein